MLTKEKILSKYTSENKIKNLQNKLIKRQRYFIFANKTSLSIKKVYESVTDILQNENNFIQCELCQENFSPVKVTENFDNDLTVCYNCQDNYYSYCQGCHEPIHCDDNNHIINCDSYCEDCFFEKKEIIIDNWCIKNKKLKALQRLFEIKKLQVNYKNLSQYNFKISNYFFTIEKHIDFFRLGSWGANCWKDLCKTENNLLKAIDWCLVYYKTVSSIKEIKKG